MKKLILGLMLCATPACAAGGVFIQDMTNLNRTMTVNADGSINTTSASGSSFTVKPLAVPSVQDSSTIAVTDTFQSVMAANTSRNGCVILNNSTHRQWVYNGTTPTKAVAFPLEAASAANAAGGSFSCTIGTGVVSDQIWITGTAADTFVAREQ